jgi:hypothetical protein
LRIYIDESGTFSGFHTGSIATVGALCVPHGRLEHLEKKYALLRRKLPKENQEVKGSLLSERDVNNVVEFLARNNVIFEITAIDVGIHSETAVKNYRDQLATNMTDRVQRFNEATRPKVETAIDQIKKCSIPLFMQAITTFDVIANVIQHIPLYFSQR